MNWIEAFILGIIQGLSEFLPISSSGHLELGKALFNTDIEGSLTFTVVVHGGTVLSTIVVFRKEIIRLFLDLLKFKWNDSTKYLFKIFLSMLPVVIVGVFFKDTVESFFDGNLIVVGSMLIVTALLLFLTYFSKEKSREITYLDSIIIGISQAFAVLPGLSRSGSTIATGLLLGNKKEEIAKFSFLMVLIPIIGANFMDIASGEISEDSSVGLIPLIIGFLAAFTSGLLACKWMISLVKRGKLIYFSLYCLSIGILVIIFA